MLRWRGRPLPQDPLVADIKALAVADSVCFRISRDALRHRIPEEVVQLLRNETAFQLTYYMGRQVCTTRPWSEGRSIE